MYATAGDAVPFVGDAVAVVGGDLGPVERRPVLGQVGLVSQADRDAQDPAHMELADHGVDPGPDGAARRSATATAWSWA